MYYNEDIKICISVSRYSRHPELFLSEFRFLEHCVLSHTLHYKLSPRLSLKSHESFIIKAASNKV